MLRTEESNVLERALGCPQIKKATYFDRVSFLGSPKKDPFEGRVDGEVWTIQGNKLLRKISKEETKE